jgi:HTH-type transcriptional regulator, sugar sensing transcriptional regulator
MNLAESLQNIGLNEKEANVYLALLQMGQATAYSISLRSGLKKPTTYVILDQLVKKGYALKIPRVKKHLFVAESPEKVIALAGERFREAQDALPELLAMKKGEVEKANVSYFEGLEGIKEMYARLIKTMRGKPEDEREYLCFYGHGKDAPKEYVDYWEELTRELHKYGIKRRTFMPADESVSWYFTEAAKMGMSSIGLPSEIYNANVSFEVFDKYVQIISHRYLQGTLIDNRDAADSLRQIFEIIWNVYKNNPTPTLPLLRGGRTPSSPLQGEE